MIRAPNPHPLAAEKGPQVPHLGVVMDEMGSLMALPPGSNIYLIEDSHNPNKITPMVLVKVSLKAITFRCSCGQKGCTRVMTYKLAMTGYHPPIGGVNR